MRTPVLLTLLFILSSAYSQEKKSIDSLVKNKFEKFQKYGVNNFFALNRYCIGSSKLNKDPKLNCDGNYELYFFWKVNGKQFIQRIDDCRIYRALEIADSKELTDSNLFDFFENNISVIKTGIVKTYKTKNGEVSTPHTCFREYFFLSENVIHKKQFNLFDLSKGEDESNMNYEFNSNLAIVNLNMICAELILNIEAENKFKVLE